VGPSRTAVVLQWPQPRIGSQEIASRVSDNDAVVGVLNQVVALGSEHALEVGGPVAREYALSGIKDAHAFNSAAARPIAIGHDSAVVHVNCGIGILDAPTVPVFLSHFRNGNYSRLLCS